MKSSKFYYSAMHRVKRLYIVPVCTQAYHFSQFLWRGDVTDLPFPWYLRFVVFNCLVVNCKALATNKSFLFL